MVLFMSNAPNLKKNAPNPNMQGRKNIPIAQAMGIAAQKVDAGELQQAQLQCEY